jgi:tripartite ATP-independent transporter DctP family solute receptor
MKLKKIVIVVLTFVLCFSLIACSGGTSSTGSTGSTGSEGSTKDKITLKLNHVGATTHPYHAGSEKFAELVSEKSNGSIEVQVFPASQIASGAKAIEFVQMNTLDIALESTMSLSNFVPEIDVLNMPFLFKDAEEAYKVLDGEAGQKLAAKSEEYGFKILGWWYNGFRDMSNSKGSIETPKDMSGLKFRIPESEVFRSAFEALGALPTSMPVSEVFTAIQLGTVDGQENPAANYINNRFNEVNKYYSETHHIFTAEPLIMSKEKFDSFSSEQQQVLLDAAKEAGLYQRELGIEDENNLLEQIRNMEDVIYNKPSDMQVFRDAVESVYEKFSESLGEYFDLIESSK